MKRGLYRNKWFILAVVVFLFFAATGAKVMAAGTDTQLATILQAGLDGFRAYLDWLTEVLTLIW